MDRGSSRTILLAASVAGVLLFLFLLFRLITGNLTSYPDLVVDESYLAEDPASTSADQPAGQEPEAAVRKTAGSGLSVLPAGLPDRGGMQERRINGPGDRKRLEKLVDLSVGSRVNRALSFNVLDNTLKTVQRRTAGNTRLAADIGYIRKQFDRLVERMDEGEVREQDLKRFMLTGLRAGKDRRITRQEFSLITAAARKDLGLELDGDETARVMASLQEPGHRREVKQALKQETAAVLKGILENPVSRRLALFGAEQVFLLYEDRIMKKVPSGVSTREVKAMFYSMLDNVVHRKIPDNELLVLSDVMVSAAADRNISPAEMEKMSSILKKYLPSPALENIIKNIGLRQ